MRKYGKWMLVLGIIAASPAVSMAQSRGFLSKAPPRAAQQAPTPAQSSQNQQMAERIAGALRQARLRGYDVGIEYRNGVAMLTGKVTDASHRERATQVVKQLRGVTRVDNRLQVMAKKANPVLQQRPAPGVQSAMFQTTAPQAQQVQQVGGQRPMPAPAMPMQSNAPSNQVVAEKIAGALSNAGLTGYDVEIRYQKGVASLGGTIGTPQQRALAEQITSQVPGVRSVSNTLEVEAPLQRVAYKDVVSGPMSGAPTAMPYGAPGSAPAMGGYGGGAGVYGSANLPDYAWPSYAQYPNSAAVTYPTQYSASAFPYVGPFYPYPQVPLGWRKAALEWDDGHWQLSFNKKTDRWWWFLSPKNW